MYCYNSFFTMAIYGSKALIEGEEGVKFQTKAFSI